MNKKELLRKEFDMKRQFSSSIIVVIATLSLCTVGRSWDGPCLPMGSCGGAGVGSGSCQYVTDPTPYCEGSCPSYCARGAADSYCLGVSGRCQTSVGNCSRIISRSCVAYASGCACEDTGVGGYCTRQTC